MKDNVYKVRSNENIAERIFRMSLEGDVSDIRGPGQFIDIKLDGFYLRRPVSIADWDRESSSLTIIYKTVGQGTAYMSHMLPGDDIQALCALGNGFDTNKIPDGAVLAGGGAGVPPLYGLAKQLIREGKHPVAALGFAGKNEVFGEKSFRELGVPVRVAAADGSYGTKGLVTDLLSAGSYVCACGPEPMLRAVCGMSIDGQFSFEERMGCGFGVCMGCSCRSMLGSKRVCKDGPVFEKGEISWQIQE